MTVTVTMNAPTGIGGEIMGSVSGTLYQVVSGIVTNVLQADVNGFLALGFTQATTTSNVGTAAAGVTALEYGNPYLHTTLLTVNTVLGAIAGGAALGLGVLLYTLPAGAQIISAARFSMAITQTQGHINTDTPTVGLGTTVASGAVSVLSGTAGFQNVGVGKAAADCNGTPTVQTSLATASPFGLVTELAAAKTLYFNVANTWAASGDAAALLVGKVALQWSMLNF